MKTHTADFKTNITNMGREIKSIVTYGNTTLEEELYAVTPHYTANLLKSVMKQLDIESREAIPINTVVNYQLGVKVNGQYEYLDYGNYVVFKSERIEEKNTYLITCYDKMVYAMKQNESLGVVYPISIKNYLSALATKIGLTLADTTFYNQNETIPAELYTGLPYTYRDILDEIAQATGSIICINNNDEIEVRYPSDTGDTIDETFFSDTNVKVGELYGPINTIVLSRSAEADNIYYPDPLPQNPIEIKIRDNQIMNFNNRANFMPGILSALEGLYFYTNDYTLKGVLYYEVGDIYHVSIGENTYQCIMLNDEINITQGIEEIINTELPEQSETDYTKADKTDQRISEAYLILDKQKRELNGVLSTVDGHTTTINTLNARVGSLESSISEIADITTSQQTNTGHLIFENINQSEPIRIEVKPIGENITYLYPRDDLFPADNLYLTGRTLRFTNTTTSEVFEWELPDDLLYYDSEHYDEFVLDYDSDACFVTKRCEYNSAGQVVVKSQEQVKQYVFPHEQLQLTDGDYTVEILKYETTPYQAYLFARLMVQNYYTTQFATRAEMNTQISQTKQDITASVNAKFTNYSTTIEMESAINVKANEITSTVSETYATKGELNTAKTEIKQTTDGISTTVSTKVGKDEIISRINQSSEQIQISADKISIEGKAVNFTTNIVTDYTFSQTDLNNIINYEEGGTLTPAQKELYDINGDGVVNSLDYILIQKAIRNNNGKINGTFKIDPYSAKRSIILKDYSGTIKTYIGLYGVSSNSVTAQNVYSETLWLGKDGDADNTYIYASEDMWEIVANTSATTLTAYNVTTPEVIQTSLESIKKNISKTDIKALDIIKNSNIYEYNLKTELDKDKKHIGFVIGDKYNTPNEVIAKSGKGIDTYTMASIMWKAIQELSEKIKE